MVSGAIGPVDTYQEMSFSSVDSVKSDCIDWCNDLWETLPQVPHCCWFGKGKASGIGFAIC